MAIDTGLPPQGTQDHVYTQPGTYTVRITDEDDGTKTKTMVINVPFGPTMTLVEDPNDADRRTVDVTVDNYGFGSVLIDWGDGPRTSSNQGNGQEVSKHKYLNPGIYTVTVSDADDPSRVIRTEVTVPFTAPKPTLTVTEDSTDATRMTVLVTVDNHDQGPVTLTFGEGAPVDNPGDGTTVSTHQYSTSGTFTIRAEDQDNAALVATEQVTVPFTATLWDVTFTEDISDPARLTVLATVTNPVTGRTYEINWSGDGTTWEDLVGNSGTHAYATGGTYNVEVRDQANPVDSRTHEVTVPFGTQFVVTEASGDSTRNTAQVTVPEPADGASYEVQWEDGAGFNALAGTPPTLVKATPYDTAGEKQVTVQQVGLPDTAHTETLTVPFTGPEFTHSQTGTEERGVTVQIADPGAESFEVNWGDDDGTTWEALTVTTAPEVAASHVYAGTGTETFVLTVRNATTTTDQATQHVSVPFPAALMQTTAAKTTSTRSGKRSK